MYGDLSPFANKTRFGVAFVAMTLGFALVAAFVFLSWLLDRPFLLWPAFLIALGFASGLSLSGHSAVEPNSSWFSQLADYLHLTAACLWAGGLVTLAVAIWPLAPELRRRAFLGFSRLATVHLPRFCARLFASSSLLVVLIASFLAGSLTVSSGDCWGIKG